MATSLPEFTATENLELQVSFETRQNGNVEMHLSLLLSSNDSEETCRRLTSLGEASATLRTVRCGEPELKLTSAWQLGLALGGSPSIEPNADRKVRVEVSIPLLASLSPLSEKEAQSVLVETNGKSS